jgi:adenylate cyclase
MLESNLEALVDNLLSAYGIGLPQSQLRRFGKSSFRPDFIARGPRGLRTAIEVRQGGVDAKALYVLYVWHDEARTRNAIDRLLLVTPEPPSDDDRHRFQKVFDGEETVQWISLRQLPGLLGIPDDIDFESPQARDHLQTASLIRKTRAYRNDVVGVGGLVGEPKAAEGDLAAELKLPRSLARQFSLKSLTTIGRSGQSPEKALRIGQECRPCVLLSDIKSFSTLVRVGDAQLIQEMMGNYYRRAREIIWAHGGVLDKFIGDAVLAIWGYPEPTGHDAADTVRAAADLIALGRSLLDEFQSRHNEAIESGTRVGIASDEVLVLNIGTDEAEISFVGNAINLAARLEVACAVDGILMDNRTSAGLADADVQLHLLAGAQETLLDERHAKGQLTRIRAWQITSDGIARVLQAARVGAIVITPS